MVILQFNKLIRNKWVWGAFAVAVSLAFCCDDLFSSRRTDEEVSKKDAGKLGDEAVPAAEFSAIAEELRGFGRQRDWKRPQHEINRQAWENYAALAVADKDGLAATDAEIKGMIRADRSFQQGGQFNFRLYEALLRENGLTPERFEAYLKRRTTLDRLSYAVLGAAAWGSPMEVNQAVYDMTDVFTVKVARFAQDRAEADKVTLDDAGLRKWYDDNLKSLALPNRIRIRYVRYDATDKAVLDKMTVTEEEMRDLYDSTIDKYTSTDTNGVETVKKFEEVKGELESKLRQIAAVQYFETNLNQRVYGVKAAKGASRLDEIAKEDALKAVTSDWFSLEGGYVEGFMRPATTILPSAKEFAETVAELDMTTEDLRYGVVSSENAVWLVERFEESPAHTPDFAEAKEAIRPQALRAAKADQFKAKVEAVIAKGKAAVLASGNVSTNFTFVISDLQHGQFPDQNAVAGAARKLVKDGVSEFTLTSPGRAVVVVCEDRKEGDAAKAMMLRQQLAEQVSMIQRRQLPEAWMKWNLERLGFTAGEVSSVTPVESEE